MTTITSLKARAWLLAIDGIRCADCTRLGGIWTSTPTGHYFLCELCVTSAQAALDSLADSLGVERRTQFSPVALPDGVHYEVRLSAGARTFSSPVVAQYAAITYETRSAEPARIVAVLDGSPVWGEKGAGMLDITDSLM